MHRIDVTNLQDLLKQLHYISNRGASYANVIG